MVVDVNSFRNNQYHTAYYYVGIMVPAGTSTGTSTYYVELQYGTIIYLYNHADHITNYCTLLIRNQQQWQHLAKKPF